MKRLTSVFFMTVSLFTISCNTSQNTNNNIISKATKDSIIKCNAKSEYDKYAILSYIKDNESKMAVKPICDSIKSKTFESVKFKYANTFDIHTSKLTGKTKADIEKYLGAPTSSESVKPSGTNCPCDKLSYLNGLVEIVYIDNLSDWITINTSIEYINKDCSKYVSYNIFDNYTYIKVSTI